MSLDTRALRSMLWVTMVVNCLLNVVAMSRFEVRVLLLKVMGWLGNCLVDLPDGFNDGPEMTTVLFM